MRDLDGKVALVTGASAGLGEAAVRKLFVRGASLMLTARRVANCENLAEVLRAGGGHAEAIKCDVSVREDLVHAVERTLESFGRIDILVNNAGVIAPIAPIDACDPDEWVQNMSINLIGMFYAVHTVLPQFRTQGSGVIVNVSSGAAHNPLEGWSAYCASKAGVAMLTRSIALEEGGAGVRVYGFNPGAIDTGMQEHVRMSGLNRISQMKREELGPVSDPATVIAWLCTDEAQDLAGQELDISDASLRQRAGLPA